MNGSQRFWANDGQVLPNPVKEELPTILKVDGDKGVYEDSTRLVSFAKSRERAITLVALSPPVPFRLFFRQVD